MKACEHARAVDRMLNRIEKCVCTNVRCTLCTLCCPVQIAHISLGRTERMTERVSARMCEKELRDK